jgi:CRISPR-associated protein Cas1
LAAPGSIETLAFVAQIRHAAVRMIGQNLSMLYLDKPGMGLATRVGRLIVKSSDDEVVYSPASHALHCIILANAGFVTTDALAWLAREHVALLIIRDGTFLIIVDAPSGRLARRELEFRCRQMECVLSSKRRFAAARSLVVLKLGSLGFDPSVSSSLSSKLTKARSIEAIMALEAEAGAIYWRTWKGQKLTFKDGTSLTFAARARSWRTGRMGETGKQFSNRFALDPFNAMLNYSGAIIVAQCARACAGLGLDPAFGILHSTRPGMRALAWDVFELLRVRTETAVFGFVASRTFAQTDFKIVREPKPHIRFEAALARDLAAHVLRRVPFAIVVKTCRTVAGLF